MSWLLMSAASGELSGNSVSGSTCPSGQYEDGPGDCRACTFSALALWVILVVSGLAVCGVAWWLGTLALQRVAAATGDDGAGGGVGQAAAHGAAGAMQARHAMTAFSATTTSYQFLFLFQIHLTWPTAVSDVWRWLTDFASLAWFRLEFLFDAFKSLCTGQYVPQAAVLLAPFAMFSSIYCVSRLRAKRMEAEVCRPFESSHIHTAESCSRVYTTAVALTRDPGPRVRCTY
jgi:hypothetical protein